MYSDANNLCGWEMIQSLPVSNFKFLTQKKNSVSENSEISYILEVDLKYCK